MHPLRQCLQREESVVLDFSSGAVPPGGSRRGRLSARLHLRGERRDLRVRELERGARLLRGLGGERLDPAEHQALVIGRLV